MRTCRVELGMLSPMPSDDENVPLMGVLAPIGPSEFMESADMEDTLGRGWRCSLLRASSSRATRSTCSIDPSMSMSDGTGLRLLVLVDVDDERPRNSGVFGVWIVGESGDAGPIDVWVKRGRVRESWERPGWRRPNSAEVAHAESVDERRLASSWIGGGGSKTSSSE